MILMQRPVTWPKPPKMRQEMPKVPACREYLLCTSPLSATGPGEGEICCALLLKAAETVSVESRRLGNIRVSSSCSCKASGTAPFSQYGVLSWIPPTLSFHQCGCRESGCTECQMARTRTRATSSIDTSKLPRCRRAMKCSAPHRSYSIIARDCSKGAKPRRTGGPLKKCRCLLLPNFLSCFRFWNLRVFCCASQVIKSSVAYRSWAPISVRFQHLPAR